MLNTRPPESSSTAEKAISSFISKVKSSTEADIKLMKDRAKTLLAYSRRSASVSLFGSSGMTRSIVFLLLLHINFTPIVVVLLFEDGSHGSLRA
ncbi:hypothetical protein Tco_1007053 [Tanacetum coccineum]|uniref:Uncharacterized protein n=1 Tax=Tanacetum coccineum TaxID=301880 RepID=A0ABQ5FJP3_9ASTR